MEHEWLTERFEENRTHLQAVAYRILGSLNEADDAVQEVWLRLSRSDTNSIENLRGWLTTVVGRVCLDMLRSRASRREEQFDAHAPEAIVRPADVNTPEQEALLAESVGLALLVVLETLAPAERLAFVLHDMFDLPFDEIARITGRSPASARQLASRARRRVQGVPMASRADLARQREVIEAFMAAARAGDFGALLEVLDPDVVRRVDVTAQPGVSREVRGAQVVAKGALAGARHAWSVQVALALVNGNVGIVTVSQGRLSMAVTFMIRDGKIIEIDLITSPTRLRQLNLAVLSD
jgi:RNA polymerase sigma factor (sigma-70 family)